MTRAEKSLRELTAEGLATTAVGALITAGLPLGPVAAMVGEAGRALIGNSTKPVDEDEGQLVKAIAQDLKPGEVVVVAELDDDGLIAFEAAMSEIGGGTVIHKVAEPDQMDCTMSTPALLGAARAMSRLGVCRGAVRGHALEAEHVMARINPLEANILRLLLLDDKLAEGRYRVAGEPIAWTTSVRMFNEIDLKLRGPCSDIFTGADSR